MNHIAAIHQLWLSVASTAVKRSRAEGWLAAETIPIGLDGKRD